MKLQRSGHSTTLLPDGRILSFGGIDDAGKYHNDAHIIDLQHLNCFSLSGGIIRGAPPKARAYHRYIERNFSSSGVFIHDQNVPAILSTFLMEASKGSFMVQCHIGGEQHHSAGRRRQSSLVIERGRPNNIRSVHQRHCKIVRELHKIFISFRQ